MPNPKVRITNLLLADQILLDSYTKKISIIGIFTQINLSKPDYVFLVPRFSVMLEGRIDRREDSENLSYKVKFQILSPRGDIFREAENQDTKAGPGSDGFRSIFHFGNVSLNLEGVYTGKVYVDGELLYEEPSFLRAKKVN